MGFIGAICGLVNPGCRGGREAGLCACIICCGVYGCIGDAPVQRTLCFCRGFARLCLLSCVTSTLPVLCLCFVLSVHL